MGPLVSLSGTLFTSIYSTVRVAYTMACDGLLFSPLTAVHSRTHVPSSSTVLAALVSILLVAFFDVQDLVGFTDITAFLTYNATAVCLLVVRYCNHNNDDCRRSYVGLPRSHDEEIIRVSGDDVNENTPLQADDDNRRLLAGDIPSSATRTRCLRSWIRKWKCFRMLQDNAMFVIMLVFFSNITLFGLLEYFGFIIATTLIGLIVGINLTLVGILSLLEQIEPRRELSFKVYILPHLFVMHS